MYSLIPGAVFLSLMWLEMWLEKNSGTTLHEYGIRPRTLPGLRGIVFSPFLHGGWAHLFFNSTAYLALSGLLFYFFMGIRWKIFLLCWFGSGLGTWLMGMDTRSIHIGASGWVYAMMFFILVSGLIRRNRSLTIVSMLVVLYYGSMIWGILPYQEQVSWEGHLAGTITGILLAFVYRNQGPGHDPEPDVFSDEPDTDPYRHFDHRHACKNSAD